MDEPPKTSIVKVVLDVLKPHNPGLIDFSRVIATLRGVKRVDSAVVEVDAETETLKLTIEGGDIEISKVDEAVRRMGGVIHSIDAVVIERAEQKR